MATERTDQGCAVSRRTFLATTSGALAGMAAFGLVNPAAAKRHPQRGGILHYGSSLDVSGLDAHQHNQNHRVHATAAMFNGLTDIDVVIVREGKTLKGRLLGLVLSTVGKGVLRGAFENSVKAIEARNGGAKQKAEKAA